jgi:hypothetical protein
MAGVAVRESVTLAGRAERAGTARAFVGGVLGPGHPCGADAMLLVSELFGNSVRHSGSGADAGRPLRAGEFAAAAGLSTDKTKVEGLRSKLRLLAARGWLVGVPGGLFTLPDHAGKTLKPGR